MQLFYNSELDENSKEVLFNKEESRHIATVLRKKEGDVLQITNGKGVLYKAKLKSVNPKKCTGILLDITQVENMPYRLHLAVAPTKLNDRFEWFLEKATEIGISEITPIICDHSERRQIKHERYDKIILGAAKQSLKAYLPKLNPAINFTEFISKDFSEYDLKCIAHCEETARQSLKAVLHAKQSILVLIGPEGDFSPSEINSAISDGFVAISLGPSRLRTETAALAICQSVGFVNEN